jgi:pimeloyl-ACP methyl ester carboxylesterase
MPQALRSDSPRSHVVPAGGLDHFVLEWDGGGDHTLFLLHGWLDCGASFSRTVQHLPPELHVVAPDFRGHGRSEWVGRGGAYHFFDYVRDLRDLVDRFRRRGITLAGHSMGGGVCLLFTGTWPEDVERLVLMEGLGPPAEALVEGPERLARFARESREFKQRVPRRMASEDEVVARLRASNERLSEDLARELVSAAAQRNDDGSWTWRHDPLHRVRSAQIYRPDNYAPFVERVSCPVLLIDGGLSWYRWEDLPARRARLADWRQIRIEGSGHMLHHERPAELGAAIATFVQGDEPPGAERA